MSAVPTKVDTCGIGDLMKTFAVSCHWILKVLTTMAEEILSPFEVPYLKLLPSATVFIHITAVILIVNISTRTRREFIITH